MPRLSLYRPEKGNDYRFFDRTIYEQFTVGATDIHIHKYLGPLSQNISIPTVAAQSPGNLTTLVFANTSAILPGMFVAGDHIPKNTTVVSKTSTSITLSNNTTVAIGAGANISYYDDSTKPAYINQSEKNIQDLLFLENRDRKYDTSIFTMRGLYRMSDNDFDLTQFGLFLTGDTIFLTVHLNDMIDKLGRKLMVGDVIELPHLKDYYPLDDQIASALKRYYVVNDASKSAEGFSPTWYPHLWRVKLQPLVDSQEYKDILTNITASDSNLTPVGDILSTLKTFTEINDAVVAQAEIDVPASGYDIASFYAASSGEVAANPTITPSKIHGYLTDTAIPANGQTVSAGISFPASPATGDQFLRLDYVPNRLFQYSGKRWVKVEDSIRTNLTPGPSNKTQFSSFVNNDNVRYSGAVGRDIIKVSTPYVPDINATTSQFTLATKTIITKITYIASHRVKIMLNSIIVPGTIIEVSGKIAIRVDADIKAGDIVEYTIYKHSQAERQSLSDALRPTADNN